MRLLPPALQQGGALFVVFLLHPRIVAGFGKLLRQFGDVTCFGFHAGGVEAAGKPFVAFNQFGAGIRAFPAVGIVRPPVVSQGGFQAAFAFGADAGFVRFPA